MNTEERIKDLQISLNCQKYWTDHWKSLWTEVTKELQKTKEKVHEYHTAWLDAAKESGNKSLEIAELKEEISKLKSTSGHDDIITKMACQITELLIEKDFLNLTNKNLEKEKGEVVLLKTMKNSYKHALPSLYKQIEDLKDENKKMIEFLKQYNLLEFFYKMKNFNTSQEDKVWDC